jgi:hypothetical protein
VCVVRGRGGLEELNFCLGVLEWAALAGEYTVGFLREV